MTKKIAEVTEVLVLNDERADDAGIRQLIKGTFGEKTIVTTIRSSRYYDTPYGPANLVVQHKNKKHILVLANKRSIKDVALENAATTGTPFVVAFDDDHGKWEGFLIGTSLLKSQTTEKAAVNA